MTMRLVGISCALLALQWSWPWSWHAWRPDLLMAWTIVIGLARRMSWGIAVGACLGLGAEWSSVGTQGALPVVLPTMGAIAGWLGEQVHVDHPLIGLPLIMFLVLVGEWLVAGGTARQLVPWRMTELAPLLGTVLLTGLGGWCLRHAA